MLFKELWERILNEAENFFNKRSRIFTEFKRETNTKRKQKVWFYSSQWDKLNWFI